MPCSPRSARRWCGRSRSNLNSFALSQWRPNEPSDRLGGEFTIAIDGLSPQNCADDAASQLPPDVGTLAMAIMKRFRGDDLALAKIDNRQVRIFTDFNSAFFGDPETLRYIFARQFCQLFARN